MNPLVLLSLVAIIFIAIGITALCKSRDDDPIDVEPEMRAADILFGCALGIMAIIIIGTCLISAAFSNGYF